MNLNARVVTKKIRLNASGCVSRDPAGFRQDGVDDATPVNVRFWPKADIERPFRSPPN
jgi:hypothetical protein